jgi:hypothetical protein
MPLLRSTARRPPSRVKLFDVGIRSSLAEVHLPDVAGSTTWEGTYLPDYVGLQVLGEKHNDCIEHADFDLMFLNWGADGTVPPRRAPSRLLLYECAHREHRAPS